MSEQDMITEVGAEASVEEATPVESSQEVSQEQAETPVVEEQQQESVEQEGEVVQEEYTPNYKFKVYDEEKEFDEVIRDAIKTKEQEEHLRDLYTKSVGIDGVKMKLEKTREELAQNQTRSNQIMQGIDTIEKAIQGGDLDYVFDVLKIPKDTVKNYVRDVLTYEEMDPHERAEYDRIRDTRRENTTLQTQHQQLQHQYTQLRQQQHERDLNEAISKPGVNDFIKSVNSRLKPIYPENGFMEEVNLVGKNFYLQNGYDMAADQAVQIVLQKYGYSPQQQQLSTVPRGAVQTKVVTNTNNTIPKTGSGNASSPSKKKITSIAALEEEAKSLIRAGR